MPHVLGKSVTVVLENRQLPTWRLLEIITQHAQIYRLDLVNTIQRHTRCLVIPFSCAHSVIVRPKCDWLVIQAKTTYTASLKHFIGRPDNSTTTIPANTTKTFQILQYPQFSETSNESTSGTVVACWHEKARGLVCKNALSGRKRWYVRLA